jgi:hypothetical protein
MTNDDKTNVFRRNVDRAIVVRANNIRSHIKIYKIISRTKV